MHNMSNPVWSKTYGVQYVSEYNDLYFVVDQISFSMEYLTTQGGNLTGNLTSLPSPVQIVYKNGSLSDSLIFLPGDWYVSLTGSSNGQLKHQMNHTDSYNMDHTYHIQYAFVNPVKDTNSTSKIQVDSILMIIVIVCNFAKSLTLSIAFMDNSTSYLITQGDALASLLARPDLITSAYCLTPYHEIENRVKLLQHCDGANEPSFNLDGDIWLKERRDLREGPSILRGSIVPCTLNHAIRQHHL